MLGVLVNSLTIRLQVIAVTAAVFLGVGISYMPAASAMPITWNVEKCYDRHPTISRQTNSTHPCVYYVQVMMKCGHYRPGSLDGVYGPKSETAVKRFQSDQRLVVDGIVGPNTWSKLKAVYYHTGRCPQL